MFATPPDLLTIFEYGTSALPLPCLSRTLADSLAVTRCWSHSEAFASRPVSGTCHGGSASAIRSRSADSLYPLASS